MNDALIERMLGEEQVEEITDYFNNSCQKDTNKESVNSLPEEREKKLYQNWIESPQIYVREPNIKLQPDNSKRKNTPLYSRKKRIIQ